MKVGDIVEHRTESEDKTPTVIDVDAKIKNLTELRDRARLGREYCIRHHLRCGGCSLACVVFPGPLAFGRGIQKSASKTLGNKKHLVFQKGP